MKQHMLILIRRGDILQKRNPSGIVYVQKIGVHGHIERQKLQLGPQNNG